MNKQIKKILKVCEQRREKGKKVYGQNAFRKKNNIHEAVEELYDTINYLLFQIIMLTEMDENIQLQRAAGKSKSIREKTDKVFQKSTRNSSIKRLKKEKVVAKFRHRPTLDKLKGWCV